MILFNNQMSEYTFTEFRATLDKHKQNETIYKEKIKQISLTRGKISDQLEILQQTYDKKLKGLEQKLEIFKNQNQGLIKQNILYKSEVENYQVRLVEKEKIIAMLLSQRKDIAIHSSEKSKSDKTESLNAYQEENKETKFKKPILSVSKQEHQLGQPNPAVESLAESKHPQSQKTIQQLEKTSQHREKVKVIAPPPKNQKKSVANPPQASIDNNILDRSESKNVQKTSKSFIEDGFQEQRNMGVKVLPIQSVAKSRPIAPPIKKRKEVKQIVQEAVPNSYDFFSNLHQEQPQQIHHSYQPNYHDQSHSHNHSKIHNHQNFEQINHTQVEQQQHNQQYQKHTQQVPQYQNELNQEQNYQDQQNQHIQMAQPVEQVHNNFLAHFNQQIESNQQILSHFGHRNQTNQQPEPIFVKKNKQKSKIDPRGQNEHHLNSADFFNQLAKTDHQQANNFQIQESSIDHIDRDNSLMSNEQPYFTEESLPKSKPLKMNKKKGKRDQIKVVDPARFS